MRWLACIAVAATTSVSLTAVSCGRIGYDPLELGEPSGTGGDGGSGGGADATGADGTMQSGDSAGGGDATAANDASDASDGSSGTGTDTGTPDGANGADAQPDADAAIGADAASVTIAIDPRQAATLTSGTITFNAEVTGSTDTAVTWSVQEGSAGGTVASGTYTAPTTVGVYHVVATSHANPFATAIAVVTVSAPAAATLGTWQDVTPATVDAGAGWGVRDVVADPVRPSDLYAVVCVQGVYKSTDYGVTWSLISTGAGAAALATNCMETLALGSSPLRDPGTPPTLYAGNIHGGWFGVQKSTDGGQSFTRYATPASTPGTVNSIDVDPGDEQHLLAGMDSGGAVVESFDAGVTWRAIAGPGSTFTGVIPFFIDTGIPSTTRTTWLIVTSGGGTVGGGGAWRTTDSGAHWTQADTLGHGAGPLQMFQAGGGVLYIGGQYGTSTHNALGVFTSGDYGATWSLAYSGNAAAVVGTPSYLYGWYDWANPSGGVPPAMKRAPRSAGTPWTALTTPAAMTNGPSKAAVTFDGSHWVIVGGCWNGGLFRYAEL